MLLLLLLLMVLHASWRGGWEACARVECAATGASAAVAAAAELQVRVAACPRGGGRRCAIVTVHACRPIASRGRRSHSDVQIVVPGGLLRLPRMLLLLLLLLLLVIAALATANGPRQRRARQGGRRGARH